MSRVAIREARSVPMRLLLEDGAELEVNFSVANVIRQEDVQGKPVYHLQYGSIATIIKNPRADVDGVLEEIERRA